MVIVEAVDLKVHLHLLQVAVHDLIAHAAPETFRMVRLALKFALCLQDHFHDEVAILFLRLLESRVQNSPVEGLSTKRSPAGAVGLHGRPLQHRWRLISSIFRTASFIRLGVVLAYCTAASSWLNACWKRNCYSTATALMKRQTGSFHHHPGK